VPNYTEDLKINLVVWFKETIYLKIMGYMFLRLFFQ